MVEKIIEGLLPGTRSLRPPLIGGILWCLLLWLIFADFIPLADASNGWFQQFYILFGALGPIAGVAVASILVFVIGATLGNLSEGTSKAIGTIVSGVPGAIAWHRHARRTARFLLDSILKMDGHIDTLRKTADEGSQRERKSNSQRLIDLERELETAKSQLRTLVEARFLGYFYRPTQNARKAIGKPPATSQSGVEVELVEATRRDGQEFAQAEHGRFFPENQLSYLNDKSNSRFLNELDAELETDPLEVLRSLSDTLFLEIDRLRAEREVRLSFATPLIGLVIYGSIQLSNPWILLTALLPLAIMIRHSYEAQQERTRVLRLIRLNKFRTPALDRAFDQGKRDIIMMIRDEDTMMKMREAEGFPN